MIRYSGRSALQIIRRCSTEPAKKVTFFNRSHAESSMTELLRRESPLLVLAKGKVERPPFLLNLFIDQFDERVLTFPEVLDTESLERCHDRYEALKAYVDSLDYKYVEHGLPDDVYTDFRNFGLYGACVPEEYGGLGLTDTEFVRVLEAFGNQPSLGCRILAHNYNGVYPIVAFGSDFLKKKYLPKLATGEMTAAFAMTESGSGADMTLMKTRSIFQEEDDYFEISGVKNFVTNGDRGDLFVVACNIEDIASRQDKNKVVSLVLIDRSWSGVEVRKLDGLLGLTGSGLSEVTFNKVKVPKDHLLGKRGEGFKLTLDLQNKTRLGVSALSLGMSREACNEAIKVALSSRRHNSTVAEHEQMRVNISSMAGQVFGMESMLYLTTAISDVVLNPNYALEAAATKLKCSQLTKEILNIGLQIGGVKSTQNDCAETRRIRDQMMLESYEAPNFINFMFLGMNGLKEAAAKNADTLLLLEDGFLKPKDFLKRMRYYKKYENDNWTIPGELDQFIHPSLKVHSRILEYIVRRLTASSLIMLQDNGAECLQRQYTLNMLGQIAAECYLSTAVLSRSSRSYCIGLKNSFHEIKLAAMLNKEILERVERCKTEIETEYEDSILQLQVETADIFIDGKCYDIEHPMKKNWS